MNQADTLCHRPNSSVRNLCLLAGHHSSLKFQPSSAPLSPQTPSLPVPRPANDATREKQIPFRNSAPQWVSMGISGRVIPASHNFAISSFVKTNNTWTVSWNSIPGGIYRVQGSTDLVNWITLTGDLSALADSMQAAFATPTQANYFFRVARPY